MKISESEELTILPNIQNPIIYFLLDNDEVVYVGQSKVGLVRPYIHKDKDFTHIAFINCKKCELDAKETELIKKYEPKYNKRIGNSDYSFNRAKAVIKAQTNICNFNLCDLKKLIGKFNIKTYEFENYQYISSSDFEKIFSFVKETSEGVSDKNVWKKKVFG